MVQPSSPTGIAVTLPEVAWALAGGAIGVFIVGVVMVILTVEFRRRSDRSRASLWVGLTQALERLQTDPSDPTARELILGSIRPGDDGHGLHVIASVLSLYRSDSVIESLCTTEVEERLITAIGHSEPAATRDALSVVGLLCARSALPVVLMRCDDPAADTRRVAVHSLAQISPLMAFEHLLPRVTSEAPWAIELLARLIAEGVTDEWLPRRGGPEPRSRSRLVDLINLLSAFLTDDDPQRSLASISALASIDHRLARVALASGLRTGHSTVEHAAAGALLQSIEGRRMLEELRPPTGMAGSTGSSELIDPDRARSAQIPDLRPDEPRTLQLFSR